jgi:hypothetical protein
MLNSIAILLTLFPGQQAVPANPAAPESAGILFSRMFALYAKAKTLSSHIRMTQSAMTKTVVIDSELSYERPFKIFFVQKKPGEPSYAPHLISDGTKFQYTAPENIDSKRVKDLKELVHTVNGDIAISEMWPEIVPSIEKGDDGFVLEAMISRLSSLRTIRSELSSFSNKGKIQYNGKVVNDIEGRWKTAGFGEEGFFSMYLTDEGDIVRQETRLNYAVSPTWLIQHKLAADAFPDGVKVTTVWDVDTVVDQPIPSTRFTLPTQTSP